MSAALKGQRRLVVRRYEIAYYVRSVLTKRRYGQLQDK